MYVCMYVPMMYHNLYDPAGACLCCIGTIIIFLYNNHYSKNNAPKGNTSLIMIVLYNITLRQIFGSGTKLNMHK